MKITDSRVLPSALHLIVLCRLSRRRHSGGFSFSTVQRCCRNRHHFTGFNLGTQATGIGKIGIFTKRVHHYQRHRFITDNCVHHQAMIRRIGKTGFG